MMSSFPRLSGRGMAWPMMESEAALVLVSHQLRRSGRPWRTREMVVEWLR